jgi:hypothetical protein
MGHCVATKGLQTHHVSVEAEFTIAQGHRSLEVVPSDIVPQNQGVPVDGWRWGIAARGEQPQRPSS